MYIIWLKAKNFFTYPCIFIYRYLTVLIFLLLFLSAAFSQSSLFMPIDIKKAYDNGTRSYDGKPGPGYWQNRSVYNIKVSIEPGTRLLSGNETITYYNNSPDTLKDIVIRLYQDINKPGAPRDFQLTEEALTSGMDIKNISLNGTSIDLKDNKSAERYGTNLTLHPDLPILPHSTAGFSVQWDFKIPKGSNIRMGTYDSATFFVAYWYPQISVYDDVHGWDRTLYMGQLEFYNDFNDYDVEISVPADYFIWSTGVLQNPEEVYSSEILERYNLALQSDSVIHIITENDLRAPIKSGRGNPMHETNNLAWHVKADNVPDFVFGVSNEWLWDAVSIEISQPGSGGSICHSERSEESRTSKNYELRTNNRTLISAVYPFDSPDFPEVADISRRTIEYYSKTFPGIPYPYPRMTVFNGDGGMEFPMMVNQGSSEERIWTVYVATHEIAHTYFPFYMGINERKYAWMDEGWAQNFSERIQKIIAPELDQQERNVFRFLNYSGKENDVPMMVISDNVHNYSSYANSSYFRPDNAYNFLEDALGHELFMKALHEYISRWHGKHPVPYDFFFTFENTAKKDLSWFFKPWFFEEGYPDLSIKKVESKEGTVKVTVQKPGNLPIPVFLTLKTAGGSTLTLSESCSVWKDGRKETVLELKTNKKIISATLGNPYIPDAVPENNIWKLSP